MALPLLPEPIIEDTYDELIAAMPQQLKNALKDLLEYFQQQWFVEVPIFQWCVHWRKTSKAVKKKLENMSTLKTEQTIHYYNFWPLLYNCAF